MASAQGVLPPEAGRKGRPRAAASRCARRRQRPADPPPVRSSHPPWPPPQDGHAPRLVQIQVTVVRWGGFFLISVLPGFVGVKRWQAMANSNTSPIMTCARILHHGGTYAQVHRPPATCPSLPLRRRVLPAALGLPTTWKGYHRDPLDGPLRRRRCISSISETCQRLAKAPHEETSAKALSANLFSLEELKRRGNASFAKQLPRSLRRRRKRPLRVGIDLTLLPMTAWILSTTSRSTAARPSVGPTHSSPMPPPTWSSPASGSPWLDPR